MIAGPVVWAALNGSHPVHIQWWPRLVVPVGIFGAGVLLTSVTRTPGKRHEVSATHADQLKRFLSEVRANVSGVHLVGADDRRTALEHHFPKLRPAFAKWDTAVQCTHDRVAALDARMKSEAINLGITQHVFSLAAIFGIVTANAYKGTPVPPLTWDHPTADGGGWWLRDYPSRIFDLDAAPGTLDEASAKSRVESFLAAFEKWPEFVAVRVRDADCGWRPLQAPLTNLLDKFATLDSYAKARGCSLC